MATGGGWERFSPELRGWAALHLVSLAPPEVREAVRTHRPSAGRAAFRRDAVLLVSRPEAVAWSREVASAWPGLGVAAGPACVLRLWVSHLLGPGGPLEAYWPGLLADVWRAVAQTLAMAGLSSAGPRGEELRHEVAAPLALVTLASLSSGRRDLRLLESGLPGSAPPDGPPFGWAPGLDAWPATLRYLLLGQVPNRFHSHALMSSPLARLLKQTGLAVPLMVREWICPYCRVVRPGCGPPVCRHCGAALVARRGVRLVARVGLERSGAAGPAGWMEARPSPWAAAGRCLSVPDRAHALAVRRLCLERARQLWDRVVGGRRHGLVSVLVLGALAGVRPLGAVIGRPPRPEWLERLVDALAELRLDRGPIARSVSRALEAWPRPTGRAPPTVRPGHVGVLATRFRRAILARPSG